MTGSLGSSVASMRLLKPNNDSAVALWDNSLSTVK
jgi:hypothetical protein